MGQLIDGVWHDTWYDTKSTGENFNALHQLSVTGSPRMAHRVQRAKGFRRRKRPLSSLRFSGLSVGASHADLA